MPWEPKLSVGSKGAGNLQKEEGCLSGDVKPHGLEMSRDIPNSLTSRVTHAYVASVPDGDWCEEEDAEPAGCLDWPLVAGFYGLWVFWESVYVPDVEIQHRDRALKTHHTPNCSQCLSLCSGMGRRDSTPLSWEMGRV